MKLATDATDICCRLALASGPITIGTFADAAPAAALLTLLLPPTLSLSLPLPLWLLLWFLLLLLLPPLLLSRCRSLCRYLGDCQFGVLVSCAGKVGLSGSFFEKIETPDLCLAHGASKYGRGSSTQISIYPKGQSSTDAEALEFFLSYPPFLCVALC